MSEVHLEEHSSPIKTPKQLIIVILLAFLIPIGLIVMLTQLVTGGAGFGKDHPGMTEEAIARRLQPVGVVVVTDANAPKVEKTGQQVVEIACAACHATGALNAPKIGDKAAWGKLIAAGQEKLTQSAIKGVRQMPPRGGNPDLTDIEFARAVAYLANQAGANWKEPESKPAPGVELTGDKIVTAQCSKCHQTGVGGAPKIGDRKDWLTRGKNGISALTLAAIRGHDNMPARGGMAELTDAEFRGAVLYMFNQSGGTATETKAEVPAAAPAKADAGKGKSVYDASCAACHASGVAGAPKAGDKAAWAPRLKSGMPALYASSLKGKNAMPPKGGNMALSEDDVKAAVDYLAGLSK
ncbi:MAG: c-type cytochrome [Burkholderiales bacterium]|nr:c-type cytochrome [Burkholderiales bacterium]